MSYEKIEIVTDRNGIRKLKVSFALWPNDKRDSEKAPNAKGYDKETGVSVVGWTKEHNGRRFVSGSIEIPMDRIPGIDAPAESVHPELNDPCPF